MDIGQWLQSVGSGNLGAAALVSIFIVLIFTGRIVPVSTVQNLLTRADQRSADYKEAFVASEEARGLQDKQITELLEGNRTTLQFIQSLQHHSTTGRKSQDAP